MDPVTAGVLIAVIVIIAAAAIWVGNHDGLWLFRRSIGTTCPACSGMGSTEENETCRACHGRRYIWGGPGE